MEKARAKADISEQNSAEPQPTATVTTATTFSQPLFSHAPTKTPRLLVATCMS